MYTYKTFHQPAQMLRSFLLLSFLTICGAFAPSMCQLEPKKPIPPALKQLKYDIPIPVKPKLKLSDIPLPLTLRLFTSPPSPGRGSLFDLRESTFEGLNGLN